MAALLLLILICPQAARGQAEAIETLDVKAFLVEVAQRQAENRARLIAEYVYRDKDTRRSFNNRGELVKELVQVFELYLLPGRRQVVRKLINVNNRPLSPERAAEEEKRIAEQLRDAEKGSEGNSPGRSLTITLKDYLRACEFGSPRRERLLGRDVIVLEFHPRPNFVPTLNEERVAATLSGRMWIDAADKMLMRLEAHSPELDEKGIAVSRRGAELLHENKRLPEGVWVPSYSRIILLNKVYPFLGRDIHTTHEYSDYKRFSTSVREAKTGTP